MGNIQEERPGLVLLNETQRMLSDEVSGVALDVPTFQAVIPIPVIVVVCCAIQVAYEFIKAMMNRFMSPRGQGQ